MQTHIENCYCSYRCDYKSIKLIFNEAFKRAIEDRNNFCFENKIPELYSEKIKESYYQLIENLYYLKIEALTNRKSYFNTMQNYFNTFRILFNIFHNK